MVDQISSGHRHTADADRGEEAGAEKLSKGQTNKTGGERGAQLRPGNYKLRKEAVQRTEERTPRKSPAPGADGAPGCSSFTVLEGSSFKPVLPHSTPRRLPGTAG